MNTGVLQTVSRSAMDSKDLSDLLSLLLIQLQDRSSDRASKHEPAISLKFNWSSSSALRLTCLTSIPLRLEHTDYALILKQPCAVALAGCCRLLCARQMPHSHNMKTQGKEATVSVMGLPRCGTVRMRLGATSCARQRHAAAAEGCS